MKFNRTVTKCLKQAVNIITMDHCFPCSHSHSLKTDFGTAPLVTLLSDCGLKFSFLLFSDSLISTIVVTHFIFFTLGGFKTLDTRSCSAELDRLYFLTATSDLWPVRDIFQPGIIGWHRSSCLSGWWSFPLVPLFLRFPSLVPWVCWPPVLVRHSAHRHYRKQLRAVRRKVPHY